MTSPDYLHRYQIAVIRRTLDILQNIADSITQETATTLRDKEDGDTGWTVLEVLCHLRDFDGYFMGRAEMMRAQDNPQLPAYDHEAIALENNYNGQDLKQVMHELCESRAKFVEFFRSLDEDEWLRAGIHPEKGHFTMEDALLQVGMHDITHIEQITRILKD